MSRSTAIAGSHTALELVVEGVPEEVAELTDPVLQMITFSIVTILIVLVGWFVVEPAISRVVRRRNRNNPTLEEAISRYVRLMLLVFGVFVGLSIAGYRDILGDSALVIAAGTLALGVAGQSVIGSLVSAGLHSSWIPSSTSGTTFGGPTVRARSNRSHCASRASNPDGGLVTIPNTTLTDESIVRPYEQGTFRMTDSVEIAYESDIDKALSMLADAASEIDGILDEPAPSADVVELGGDGVLLQIQYWVGDPAQNRVPVRSELIQLVITRFEANGIEISPSSKRDLEGRIQVTNSQSG